MILLYIVNGLLFIFAGFMITLEIKWYYRLGWYIAGFINGLSLSLYFLKLYLNN